MLVNVNNFSKENLSKFSYDDPDQYDLGIGKTVDKYPGSKLWYDKVMEHLGVSDPNDVVLLADKVAAECDPDHEDAPWSITELLGDPKFIEVVESWNDFKCGHYSPGKCNLLLVSGIPVATEQNNAPILFWVSRKIFEQR